MITVAPLFSTPVYIGEIDITLEEKIHCSSFPKSLGAFPEFYITHDDRILDDPALANLKNKAIQHLEYYVTEVYQINQDRLKFYINTSWVSDMGNESHVAPHRHNHSIFTGVIVLDSTPASSLFLENPYSPITPSFFNFNFNDYNTYNSRNWYFDLVPNQIYIFPSDLGHSAKCMLPDGKLSVIAFDTFIKGTIGKHSDQLTFS